MILDIENDMVLEDITWQPWLLMSMIGSVAPLAEWSTRMAAGRHLIPSQFSSLIWEIFTGLRSTPSCRHGNKVKFVVSYTFSMTAFILASAPLEAM